jgi:hypothetical protein
MRSAARTASASSGSLPAITCGHVIIVPGGLVRDGPSCAEREVQVLRVLPDLAEDPLQDMAARDGVLFGERIEHVRVSSLSKAADPHVPTQEPYPLPLTMFVVALPGDPDITGQNSQAARRAWPSCIRDTRLSVRPSPVLVSR